MTKFFILTFIFLFPCKYLFAEGFKGSIEFTEIETQQAQIAANQTAEETSKCLEETLNSNQIFFQRWGISKYYGDTSEFGNLSTEEKLKVLEQKKLPTTIFAEMQPISCIGLTLTCLETGFKKSNLQSIWTKLKEFVRKNDQDGLALQEGLRALGWKVLYWNPLIARNDDFDRYDKKNDPLNEKKRWGYHSYRWNTVQKRSLYLNNTVDDFQILVDFGIRPTKLLEKIPLFIGTAHGGYHVFSGSFAKVVEGHGSKSIESANTVESSKFNPLTKDGAPSGGYWSGLIAIPPGFLTLLQKN